MHFSGLAVHRLPSVARPVVFALALINRGFHAISGLLKLVPAIAMLALAAPSSADEGIFETIREADTLMARIGYRLATANAPLCDRLEPGLGLVLHTPEQYVPELREDAIRHFRFTTPVGVEAVIPGSPAAVAGIEADDALFDVGGIRFANSNLQAGATTDALIRASTRIAALAADEPTKIQGQRAGQNYTRIVDPVPACQTRFELIIKPDFIANADGSMVQLSSRFFEKYSPDLVAAVVAHELAHNILHHRERLEEQGVSYGLLSGFGRNVRYFRQTELEADILSVSLLANAGYDPAVAARFWESYGPGRSNIFRSRSHPAWQDRLQVIRHAIANLDTAKPHRPAILEVRNRSLDGDWQSLLAAAAPE